MNNDEWDGYDALSREEVERLRHAVEATLSGLGYKEASGALLLDLAASRPLDRWCAQELSGGAPPESHPHLRDCSHARMEIVFRELMALSPSNPKQCAKMWTALNALRQMIKLRAK